MQGLTVAWREIARAIKCYVFIDWTQMKKHETTKYNWSTKQKFELALGLT
jgi:hypothetical protein